MPLGNRLAMETYGAELAQSRLVTASGLDLTEMSCKKCLVVLTKPANAWEMRIVGIITQVTLVFQTVAT